MIALLVAGAFSLFFTLFTTPLFIRLFKKLNWGQFIRDDGPQTHHTKRGTPTMGGIVFIVGAILGYLVGHAVSGIPWTMVGVLVIGMMAGMGLIGFLDDFLKTRKQRSLGLGGWSKILGQVIIGSIFAVLAVSDVFRDENGLTPGSHFISVVRDVPWLNLFAFGVPIGIALFIIWVNLIAVSASNGVNVADGLDGLASGSAIFAISAYIFIGFWQANQSCFNQLNESIDLATCYDVRDPIDLAVIAAAICGALIGFLWWNTSPAHIFMGDTGSLGLGGALAALAILSRTELLLVLIGGLYLIVTGSVILQRVYFKVTKWSTGTGRRVFLMSPIHHHFELKGWAEVTVVVRFWLISALFVAAGVGVFYLEWIILDFVTDLTQLTGWNADWRGLRVAVLGLGVTGFAAADTLAELGADVLVIADSADDERRALLGVIGARFSETSQDALSAFEPELVIASPGYHPDHDLLLWAAGHGIPVWGDVELAWRLRDKVLRADGTPAEWILITGTNGKTTTTQLTATMLVSAGLRAAPCGNIGVPVLDAIRDPGGFDVLVVELSSYQLHWFTGIVAPLAAVCLNLADDHYDWHGSAQAYRDAKAKVYENVRVACVYNRADEATREMVEGAEVQEGARAIGFGAAIPGPSDLGIVEGILVDRAFLDDRHHSALELATLDDLHASGLSAPHSVANVLAAAALARAADVPPAAIRDAVRAFRVDAHRTEVVAEAGGVVWVDDSKATNAHAADAALKAYASVVWIAGGQLKGVDPGPLVAAHAARLRGVILVGIDRDGLREAIARHAPGVLLIEVDEAETVGVMPAAVRAAASVAQPGDVVLLAPSAASFDQFTGYADRGERFAAAVREHLADEGGSGDDDDASPPQRP